MREGRFSVLVIGGANTDAPALCAALRQHAPQAQVSTFESARAALARLEQLAKASAESPPFDAVIVEADACEVPLPSLGQQFAEILPDAPLVAVLPSSANGLGAEAERSGFAVAVPAAPALSVHLSAIVRLVVENRRLEVEIRRQREQLLELAWRDDLTGLANRRRFNEAIDLEVERAARFHRPLTLVLIDLDALKLVNDTHGHQAGDAALVHIGECLRSKIRRFEVAARIGGDEFAVLLVDTNFDTGRSVAEKLRQKIASTPVPPIGEVTISAGIASLPAHAETAAELIRVADEALYDAKRQGRNRIVVSRNLRQERSGDRHKVRFKIVVAGRNNRGEPFTEETETELVSRHGARIVSKHTVATGEQVELRTPFHERPLRAQITSCYRGDDNRWHVGFKLVDPVRWGS